MYKFNIGPGSSAKHTVNTWCEHNKVHFLTWRYTTSLHPYLSDRTDTGIAYDMYVIFKNAEDALAFSLAFGIEQEDSPAETEIVYPKSRR